MATRRQFLATQFEITENDRPQHGLIASTLAMGIEAVESMLVSDNLFLRKLGKKAIELQDATLPDYLITEKTDWEKAIAETMETLKAENLAHASLWAEREEKLKDVLSDMEVSVLADNAQSQCKQEQEPVYERIDIANDRLKEIALYPVQSVNDKFLDMLYAPVTVGNGNGKAIPVDSKVWVVKLNGKTFYVAIEDKNKWRLYNDSKQRIFSNTDFPDVTMTSRTRIKQVLYVLEHKGQEKVNNYPFSKVKAGGSAGVNEYCAIDNFVTE